MPNTNKKKVKKTKQKRTKKQMTDGIEMTNQGMIRKFRQMEKLIRNWKYWNRYHQTSKMKENTTKVYLRGTRRLLESKHYSRNLIKAINT